MMYPTSEDWSFADIVTANRARGNLLERAGRADDLMAAVASALSTAIAENKFRVGVDSKRNEFKECRVIVQFQVPRCLYDWFFNGRYGYRAHYWMDPNSGNDYNSQLTEALAKIVTNHLSSCTAAYKIRVDEYGAGKIDGTWTLEPDLLRRSLTSAVSKMWIGERLIEPDGMKDVVLSVLGAAATGAKLNIPKWKAGAACTGEGLRAPYPEPEHSWLDVKGAFIDSGGRADQIKSQDNRALSLHACGWT